MILGILGSAAKGSGTRRLLEEAQNRCLAAGHAFDLVDLAVEYRELHDRDVYDDPPPGSQTAALRERVAGASAVLLATPVHHGSYSGLLKNALDHLTGEALMHRPVGLIAHGSGAKGVTVAAEHLRTVVRAMGGWTSPTSVSATSADFTDDGPSQAVRNRLGTMLDELTAFAGGTLPGQARG